MKNGLLALLFFMAMASMAQNVQHDYFLFVGTYTNERKTNGIHVMTFDSRTGDFHEKFVYTDINNPSFLAVSGDGKNVYAVSEAGKETGVYAFAFDPAGAKLELLNTGTSGGDFPCYVSVDSKKRTVFTGNYGGGSLSATRLADDGSLTRDVQVIQHEGRGVNKDRQEGPHVHAVVLSPDEEFLFVPDLGTDKVNVYAYRDSEGILQATSPAFVNVNPGGGPRHLAFHPQGNYAYLILEMEGAVIAFDYSEGKLTERQRITMLTPGFNGSVGAADIHVSPDGRFVYASNRGDANEIVIYAVGADGTLAYAGRHGTGIKTPRNFSIDPTGNFLLVANQSGNNVLILRRDKATGMLSSTGKEISVDRPVCLKFLPIE